MKRETIEKYLLTKKGADRSYPFGPDTAVFKVMGKMFAYVSDKEGVSIVTVKCIPFDGEILREQFKAISPGYHMNKKHWITISLAGCSVNSLADDIPDDMLTDLVNKSYELVVSKLTKAAKSQLEQQASE